MADLPRPSVSVTRPSSDTNPGPHDRDIVISRDNKARSYRVTGNSPDEVLKGTVEKIIGDRYTGEWIP